MSVFAGAGRETMLRRLMAASVLVTASLLLWMVRAESAVAAANPPQQASGPPVPTFRVNTSLVLVDVVVREKKEPVLGLKSSDFRVWEDGKPQTITVFEEHKATDVQEPAAETPVLPQHVYANLPQYRTTSSVNVLLLDALNTQQTDQIFARQQILKYLHAIPPGTQIALFTLASRLRMISGFTTDVDTIEKALNQNSTSAQKGLIPDSPSDTVAEKTVEERMNAVATVAGNTEPTQQLGEFEKDRQQFQADQRTEITLGAFAELARYLSAIPGRKNMIWISGGLSAALDYDVSRQTAARGVHFESAVRIVNAELQRARVAVYPVDARALMNLTDSSPANEVARTEIGLSNDTQTDIRDAMDNDLNTPQQWGDAQQEMKRIAADTGGRAFTNTNAVGEAVEAAIADGKNYYTLAYAPSPAKNNGAFHTIKVEVADKKYELAYRRGYFATDSGRAGQQPAMPSPMAEAMQPGVPPLSQVIFLAQVLPAGDPELRGLKPTPGPAGKPPQPLHPPVTRYFVTYAIERNQLALKSLPDGKQQAGLEIAQAVFSPDGRRLNFTDVGLDINLPAGPPSSLVRVRQEIDVPAQPVHLQLGLRDASSGRIGTLQIALHGTD